MWYCIIVIKQTILLSKSDIQAMTVNYADRDLVLIRRLQRLKIGDPLMDMNNIISTMVVEEFIYLSVVF